MSKHPAIVLLLLLCLSFGSLSGQTRKTPPRSGQTFQIPGPMRLDSLTQWVHRQSGTRFSFNSSRVQGSKQIPFTPGRYTLDEILQQIKRRTTLYYSYYEGYVIFQDHPPKTPAGPVASASGKPVGSGSPQPKPATKATKPSPSSKTSGSPNKPGSKPRAAQLASATISPTDQQNAPPQPVGDTTSRSRQRTDSATTDSMPPTLGYLHKTSSDSAVVRQSSPHTVSPDTTTVKLGATDTGKAYRKSPSVVVSNTRKKDTSGNILNGFHLGLQWSVNLPVNAAGNYFTGTNAKTQWYPPLIPALWVSRSFGKKGQEILLLVKPEQEYFLGNTTVALATGPAQPPTDTLLAQTTTGIVKSKGLSLQLSYLQPIGRRWSIGLGLQYQFQRSALVTAEQIRLQDGAALSTTKTGIRRGDSTWSYLRNGSLQLRLEASYQWNTVAIGVAGIMPPTSPFTDPIENRRPFNAQLFLRWRLW